MPGMTETRGQNVVRTEADHGPAELRREYSATPERFVLTFTFTDSEMATFWTWYEGTIYHGSLPFDWKHPRTGGDATFRFRGADPPVFTNIGTGGSSSSPINYWRGSLDLDVLPTGELGSP
jgi:hypothetical protein